MQSAKLFFARGVRWLWLKVSSLWRSSAPRAIAPASPPNCGNRAACLPASRAPEAGDRPMRSPAFFPPDTRPPETRQISALANGAWDLGDRRAEDPEDFKDSEDSEDPEGCQSYACDGSCDATSSFSGARPFENFAAAAKAALELLQAEFPFQLWMVARVNGDDWTVVQASDRGYCIAPGDSLRWSDSFCSRMVRGLGPQIAPRAADVPAYVAAPIGSQIPIGAYVGIPLLRANGQLFGTLCAIDPEPQPAEIVEKDAFLQTIARFLAGAIQQEAIAQDTERALERLQLEAQTDCLTGAYNRRGWEATLKRETARCNRLAIPAAIAIVDLDDLKVVNDRHGHDAGDRLLVRAIECLRGNARAKDTVARLGGDEFGWLLLDLVKADAARAIARLQAALDAAQIRASVGWAVHQSRESLHDTARRADSEMYRAKRDRKARVRS